MPAEGAIFSAWSRRDEKSEMPRRRPAEETARLGDELYERAIRPQVELSRHGQIVAIDVDSGSWAVADTVLEAAELLRVERPDATNVWSVRVGHRAVYGSGDGSATRAG